MVEDGYEDYGSFPETYAFYIVEGTAFVETDEGEVTVGPGDTVLAIPGRRLRFRVVEPVKVFYVTCGARDILIEQEVRRKAVRDPA